MIRDMLKYVFIDKLPFFEVARKLDIPQERFRSRVDMLLHMGYIRESNISGTDCTSCSHCVHKRDCTMGFDDIEDHAKLIKGYELTEKGKRSLDLD